MKAEIDITKLPGPQDFIDTHGQEAFEDFYRCQIVRLALIAANNDKHLQSHDNLPAPVMALESTLESWLDNAQDYLTN